MNGGLLMQYLKDDVKDRILSSALREFKEHGYINSSMRKIAQNANITSGNIYRYFTNKAELFDTLIKPVYERFMKYILDIRKELKGHCYGDSRYAIDYIHKIDNTLILLFEDYSVELNILLDNSKGSKYENVKEDLKVFVDELLKENISEKGDACDSFITYVLASNLVDGMCIILKNFDDGDKIKSTFDKFIAIYATGVNGNLTQLF